MVLWVYFCVVSTVFKGDSSLDFCFLEGEALSKLS